MDENLVDSQRRKKLSKTDRQADRHVHVDYPARNRPINSRRNKETNTGSHVDIIYQYLSMNGITNKVRQIHTLNRLITHTQSRDRHVCTVNNNNNNNNNNKVFKVPIS